MGTELILALVALVIQLGGLIWAGGKFSASVNNLDRVTQNLEKAVQHLTRELFTLHTEVELIKQQLDMPRRPFGAADDDV